MFENIYKFPRGTSELTVALTDGADVRYVTTFLASDDGHLSSVSCSVIHAGNSAPVDLSVCEHCRH